MFQLNVEIVYNKRIKGNYFEIALDAKEIAACALPGQFVNIKVSNGLEPLLRRPFSIHQVRGQIIILYEVVGKGTEILAQKKAGEYLDVIGPLGNSFDFRPLSPESCPPILVAGGMGTAPLVFLAEELTKRRTAEERRKTIVLIGAKTKEDILCEKEFKDLGCEIKIATDDGSRGFKGYVSDLLIKELSAFSSQPSALYSCGPKLLLKEISRISQKHNIPAQISLEAHIACGIGACMGCVVKQKAESRRQKVDDAFEYKRVCKEGPVFGADEIVW